MTVRVANRRHTGAGYYVGRPTPLGNGAIIGRDGTRTEVIAKYKRWFHDRLVQGDDPKFDAALAELRAAYHEGDITLLCWCAPKACHADVIAKYLEETYSTEGCACHCHD